MITGSKLKGLLMIALGFLLSSVGMDMVNGNERFTFGVTDLTAGIELLAVVIGLFGISEILLNVESVAKNSLIADRIKKLIPTWADWKASFAPILRGSGLGFLLGIVPGGGPITASFMSYAMERRIARA